MLSGMITGQQAIPMPKGPRGEKRPPDVIGNAVKVMRIATGEEAEQPDRRQVGRSGIRLARRKECAPQE